MPTFVYRAYSTNNEVLDGEIEASTEDVALQILATKTFLTKELAYIDIRMKTAGEAVTDHRLHGYKAMRDRFVDHKKRHLGIEDPEPLPDVPQKRRTPMACFVDILLILVFLALIYIVYMLFWS